MPYPKQSLDRRRFLLKSAGLAGAFLPAARLLGATACPPPTLSIGATGGPSVTTSCGTVTQNFNFYIAASGGNDNGPGTINNPWTINALNTHQSVYAGQTVGLLDGTYDVSTFSIQQTGVLLQVASGSSGSPTVIQAVNPLAAIITAKQGATYNGNGPLIGNGVKGGGANETCSYITLRNLTITGAQCTLVSFAGLTAKTCPGIVIDSCHIYDIQSSSAEAAGVEFATGVIDGLINNCNIHDCYVGGTIATSHQNCSAILDYANGTTVQYCTLWNSHNLLNQKSTSGATPPDGLTARYNYMYSGATGSGAALVGFNNGLGTNPFYAAANFYNNIIENVALYANYNTGTDGLQADMNFYNNTYYVDGHSAIYTTSCIGPFVPSSSSSTVRYYNNLHCRVNLASNTGTGNHGDVQFGSLATALSICNFNRYNVDDQFGTTNTISAQPATLLTFVQWQTANASHDAASITASPVFVGGSGGANTITAGGGVNQYVLNANSPGKNAGWLGGTSSSGQATDIGAWGNGAQQIGSTIAA